MYANLWNTFIKEAKWDQYEQRFLQFEALTRDGAPAPVILQQSVGLFSASVQIHTHLSQFDKMQESFKIMLDIDPEFVAQKRLVDERYEKVKNVVYYWAGASHAIGCFIIDQIVKAEPNLEDLRGSVHNVYEKASVLFKEDWPKILSQSETGQFKMLIENLKQKGDPLLSETSKNSGESQSSLDSTKDNQEGCVPLSVRTSRKRAL